MRRRDPEELVEAAAAGDRGSLARLLSLVERGGDGARAVGRLAYPLGGKAYTVGITGAPGAGKSSLTNRIIELTRARGEEIAVLAVDPSSPFTGGAILGDRVRMQDHALDAGVFIRSMASRGHLGGLSLATPEAVRVLDAAGIPLVVIETVGVGQVEVEIAGTADTTLVVVNPGWGDAVQANKAGLLEIADVFVINKADRPGVAETRRDLEQMLELTTHKAWTPPIVVTKAVEGESTRGGGRDESGIEELWSAIDAHRAHLESTGELDDRRRRRLTEEMRHIVARRLEQRAYELAQGEAFASLQERVLRRELDPWSAADEIIEGAA